MSLSTVKTQPFTSTPSRGSGRRSSVSGTVPITSPVYANAYTVEACYKYNNQKERNLFDKFIKRVMDAY